MKYSRVFLCFGALLLISFSSNPRLNAAEESFIAWFDDVSHDASLLIGRSFSVNMQISPSTEIAFDDKTARQGKAFLFGSAEAGKDGKTVRGLKCVNLKTQTTVDVPLPSFARNAEMRDIESEASGNWRVHFWDPVARALPKSHTVVELDGQCQLLGIRNLPVVAEEWEALDLSVNRPGVPQASYLGTERPAGLIEWPKDPVTILFSSINQQPKLYVFRGDALVGVRPLALGGSLGPVFFVKTSQGILIKALFHVESARLRTDKPNSATLLGTATWASNARNIDMALLSRPWMIIRHSENNKEVITFYNLQEILDAAAKQYSPDATGAW